MLWRALRCVWPRRAAGKLSVVALEFLPFDAVIRGSLRIIIFLLILKEIISPS